MGQYRPSSWAVPRRCSEADDRTKPEYNLGKPFNANKIKKYGMAADRIPPIFIPPGKLWWDPESLLIEMGITADKWAVSHPLEAINFLSHIRGNHHGAWEVEENSIAIGNIDYFGRLDWV